MSGLTAGAVAWGGLGATAGIGADAAEGWVGGCCGGCPSPAVGISRRTTEQGQGRG